MKRPTEEDFDRFVGLTRDLEARVSQKLGHNWWRGRSFAIERDQVRRVLLAAHEATLDLGEEIHSSKVGKWFAQKDAQTAFMRIRGQRKPRPMKVPSSEEVLANADRLFSQWTRRRTQEDYANFTVPDIAEDGRKVRRPLREDEFTEYVERANDVWQVEKRIEFNLKRLIRDNSYLYLWRALAQAFNGYFYKEAFRRYSVKAKVRQDAADRLLRALTALSDERMWELSGVESQMVLALGARWRKAEDALRASLHSDSKPLIKKIDGTAPERALIYELWSMLHPINGTQCVYMSAAIYHLANMPGIKNPPPSADAVGDMIRGWEEEGFHPRKIERIR